MAELANTVNDWCAKHGAEPLDARVGSKVNVRNVRYYQTLGLVDRPVTFDGRGFTEKHRLQLVAIRLLQAKGLPLHRIQRLLYGRGEEDLREIERRGLGELRPSEPAHGLGDQSWTLTQIADDVLLLVRTGRAVTAAQQRQIRDILASGAAGESPSRSGSSRAGKN